MKRYKAKIQIHYEGDISEDHQIPMRVLGLSLIHIQKALDRAYLDLKYSQGVWKHARMSQDDYLQTEFLVEQPKKGGYILDFFSRQKQSPKIADRVSRAISQAIGQAEEQHASLPNQLKGRKRQVKNKIIKPRQFDDVVSNPSKEVKRKYGDRSIAKEIDQILSILRAEYSGDSSLGLNITGSSTQTFSFDKIKSNRFHKVVAGRQLGPPVIYKGKIQALDKKNKSGKFLNIKNGRTSILHFNNEKDFLKVHPYLGVDDEINFIGCPLVEFGSLEPNSGDVYFLYLKSEF